MVKYIVTLPDLAPFDLENVAIFLLLDNKTDAKMASGNHRHRWITQALKLLILCLHTGMRFNLLEISTTNT